MNVDRKFKGEWDTLRDRYKDLDFHGIPQDADAAHREAEVAVSVPFRTRCTPHVIGQRGNTLREGEEGGHTQPAPEMVEPSGWCGPRKTAR